MAKLYDLTGEYLALQDALESDDPVVVQDALARIGTVEDALEQKLLNVAQVIRNYESDLDGFMAEQQRINGKVEGAQARLTSIRTFLHNAMRVGGIDSIKGPSFTIRRKLNPYSVIVDDEAAIPAQFMVTPEPPPPPKARPDKNAIKEAVTKLGEVVPGVRVERAEKLELK